jgi:hypothetical protein
MSVLIRNRLPYVILLATGLMMILDYYLVLPETVSEIANQTTNIAVAVGAFAVLIGTISLVRRNGQIISKRREGWQYGAWSLFMMVLFIVIGLIYDTSGAAYTWLFDNVYSHINITVMSLLAFYIVTSFYRAFVARSWEAAVMLVASAFTLIGRAPIGSAIWPGFLTISTWIGKKAAVGGISGFYICGAIGSVAITLRILWGKEKAALG